MMRWIRKRGFMIVSAMMLILSILVVPVKAESAIKVDIYLFGQDGCLHCADEKAFLDPYVSQNTTVQYHYYEVLKDDGNAQLMAKIGVALDIPTTSTPLTIIGSQYVVGFISGTTDQQILDIIAYYQENPTRYRDIVGELIGNKNVGDIGDDGYTTTTFNIPFLGKIEATKVSLPLLALVMGTLDGFNPCAMWALLFLMSMLFNMDNKRKVWILGLTFLGTSALVYFGFMVAWLNLATYLSSIRLIQIGIAAVALIGGFYNLRKYLKARKEEDGCEVIDESRRKRMMKQVLSITSQKVFVLAVLGTMALAFFVNLFELLCSAGLPMIFTQILSMNALSPVENGLYLLIYMICYLLDDIIVFAIGMWTMKLTGFSTKYAKYSHLIGGILMIVIGILMIVHPEWLRLSFS